MPPFRFSTCLCCFSLVGTGTEPCAARAAQEGSDAAQQSIAQVSETKKEMSGSRIVGLNWASAKCIQLGTDTQHNKPQQLENENQHFVGIVSFLQANPDSGV